MTLRSALVAQFRRPKGAVGALVGWIMANRPSNVARNRWTVDVLGLEPADHVLEIGCGPGLALAECAARIDAGRIAGVDHSAVMIAQSARRNAAALRRGALTLRTGGLEALADLGGGFTKAFSVNVAQFFPDRTLAFRTIGATMAPGGLIAATYQPRTSKPSTEAAMSMAGAFADALDAAGFIDMRTEILPLRPAPAVCVLARKPAA